MKVQVLGVGCAKCNELYEAAEQAITDVGVEAELTKVQALDEIAAFGVTSLPGLAVDGEVKSSGRIPKIDEIARWLAAEST